MKSISWTVVVLLALLLVPVPSASARQCGYQCGFWLVDWCAWRTTACVPFALETMRPYDVSRAPACGLPPLYWVSQCEPGCCEPQTSDGFEPAEFQHLGHIPNDMVVEDIR